jgi:hypothetical protein
MKTACALLLFTALGCAQAQGGDPLKSDACGSALATLQSTRNANAGAAAVEAQRAAAARVCLGTAVQPTRPSRVAQPPVVVPPTQIVVTPQPPPSLPPVAAPPPPVAFDRPLAPALCDAGGCWVNDGTHLRQVQPSVVGPRGPCTSTGGAVYCP